MEFFVIQQSDTYEAENIGRYPYIWTPQLAGDGTAFAGFSRMKDVHIGDILFNVVNGRIVAYSVAYTECFEAPRPDNLAAYSYTEKGYQINTKFFGLKHKIDVRQYKDWFVENFIPHTAFAKDGYGGGRLRVLPIPHAVFLIQEILKYEENKAPAFLLRDFYNEYLQEADYSETEIIRINDVTDILEDAERPKATSERKPQEVILSASIGAPTPKRDNSIAAKALSYAGFKCEYNRADRTFKRKNGKPYTEPHHLIPLSRYMNYDLSLDVTENIVSLCSHCHNLLHYGAIEEKEPVLRKLYEDRKDMLAAYGLEISYEELKEYYE